MTSTLQFPGRGPIPKGAIATTLAVLLSVLSPGQALSSSGTEGASFLDIPVGAGPAALGSAYTALASDAYAPTWNPAGLGFLDSPQIAGQHLAYLQSISYEYASAAIPLGARSQERAVGVSVQYLGSGDIAGTDINGNPNGTYSSYFAAYNLSYGQGLLEDKLSLGLTGKVIAAKIQDVSAQSYAADLGGMYRFNRQLTLGATLTNLGKKLTFLNDGDPLPLAFHLGASYQVSSAWTLALEGVYPKTGLASAHVGVAWQPVPLLSLRAGYRTDTTQNLSALAGFSTGLGLTLWGQELSYAWVPYGDLGASNYISLVMRFGGSAKERNLITYQRHAVAKASPEVKDPETETLKELLSSLDSAEEVAHAK